MTERARRDALQTKLSKMANEVVKNWTRAGEDAIWEASSDWNREHPDCELAVYEVSNDDDEVVGFAIEDEVFYY